MKITLITGQQGTGKTNLINLLHNSDKGFFDFDRIIGNIFSFKNFQASVHNNPSNVVIIDDCYPSKELIKIINFCKEQRKSLVICSNLPESEFNEIKFDWVFELKSFKYN